VKGALTEIVDSAAHRFAGDEDDAMQTQAAVVGEFREKQRLLAVENVLNAIDNHCDGLAVVSLLEGLQGGPESFHGEFCASA
jgi:hypothetical protein